MDRKSQKNKLKKHMARSYNQPIKSTSLGSFNFIARPDDTSDAISVTSANSEHKRMKEKQWYVYRCVFIFAIATKFPSFFYLFFPNRCETALDGPIIKQKHPSPTIPQPPSPMYWRDKNKLSSQSMHSPGRNAATNQSTTASKIQKQPLPSPTPSSNPSTNLNKSQSNSATMLPTTDSISDVDYYNYQQQLSPPYYHTNASGKAPAPLPITSSSSNAIHDTPLRRTASSVSSNRAEYNLTSNDINPTSPTSVHATEISNYANLASPSANNTSDIHIESPQNMTIVQQAKFQPYKEVTKPFEMSDFYKYSTKFRQKNPATGTITTTASPAVEQSSPQLPPKNINLMQHRAMANNTPSIAATQTPYTIRYH